MAGFTSYGNRNLGQPHLQRIFLCLLRGRQCAALSERFFAALLRRQAQFRFARFWR